jgi:hypothetical protein
MINLRRGLAGLAATALMALAVTNASANRLSITAHNFRVVWTALEFVGSGGFNTVRCPVTLEGSFHYNTMVKVIDALLGHISRASVNSAGCASGHATILTATLPWRVSYHLFRGTLPGIAAVRLLLQGFSQLIEVTNVLRFFCLARTTAEHPGAAEASVEPGGNFIALTPEVSNRIPTVNAGGAGCPEPEGAFTSGANDGQITQLGSSVRIRLTLI